MPFEIALGFCAGRKKSPKLPEAPSAGEGSTPGAQSGVKEEQPEKDKGPGQVEGEGKDPVIAPKVEDPKPKDEKEAEDEGYYSEEEEEESGESRSITGDEVEAPTREKEPQPPEHPILIPINISINILIDIESIENIEYFNIFVIDYFFKNIDLVIDLVIEF